MIIIVISAEKYIDIRVPGLGPETLGHMGQAAEPRS